jgi:hypothetical protein
VALTRSNSKALQRQVDLTTAVCQERLLATHVRHVLALVDLVADELPFDNALDIYARILRLNPEQARNVGSRAFATLGRRSGVNEEAGGFALLDDDLHDDGGAEPASGGDSDGGGRFDAVFSRVRRRIKGRVQEDLRNRINLAAARAEDHVFTTHVENALIFAKALADEMPVHEAVDLYLDIMSIPDGVSDVIFNRALRTVADDKLPPLAAPQRTPRVAGEADATAAVAAAEAETTAGTAA